MTKFEVVFLKGRELQSIAFSDQTEKEARKIADTLNDGLQDKAKDMGFRYEARPQERTIVSSDSGTDSVTTMENLQG